MVIPISVLCVFPLASLPNREFRVYCKSDRDVALQYWRYRSKFSSFSLVVEVIELS